jgi:ribosome biogenesis protein MAK21
LPDLPVPPPSFSFNADLSAKLEAQGQALMAQSSDQYAATFDPESLAARKQKNTMGMSNSDKTFFSSILKSGTSSDKVSALTLMAASSPVHCTPYLTQLMAFCSKKSRDQSLKALRSVVDWLNEQGLPPHRKLRWFDDQPMLKQVAYARSKVKSRTERTVGDEHLILFCFEAWLKRWYLDMLKLLEVRSPSALVVSRSVEADYVPRSFAFHPHTNPESPAHSPGEQARARTEPVAAHRQQAGEPNRFCQMAD